MSPREFVEKWQSITLTERASAQSHFNDLCDLLGEPKPHDVDPTGEFYAFEKGAEKLGGANGWADVWKKDCFAWEYKGPHKDLEKALAQVKQYLGSLNNPPFMVACDIQHYVILSNWTNQVPLRIEFTLQELLQPEKRSILKRVFRGDPSLKSGESRAQLTQKVAGDFSDLARELQDQGKEQRTEDEQKSHSLDVAHFVIRLAFCMYAEDAGLLGEKLFTRLLETAIQKPDQFQILASNLFAAMSTGGLWGVDSVEFFNGGLFEDNRAFPLTRLQIERVKSAAKLDWSSIDPSILGTLFERGLDPAKRSQLGAHYTDPINIMRIVEPVILRPLNTEWTEIKLRIASIGANQKLNASQKKKRATLVASFLDKLRNLRVLDPACGSGNFLYMALRSLKDFELRVINEAEELGIQRQFPQVGPEILKGIELNVFAAELARISIWIGELQWQLENGFNVQRNPILRPLDSIQCRDALLNEIGDEAEWPDAEYIIGNPPFLGGGKIRGELGDIYYRRLRDVYRNSVGGQSDLVAYWFYKCSKLSSGFLNRFGFVSTQRIRHGVNNREIVSVLNHGWKIFEAWQDEPWHDKGALVRTSVTCFLVNSSNEETCKINGNIVSHISPDLTSGLDLTVVKPIDNCPRSVNGVARAGKFDVGDAQAIAWLSEPNVSGKPNSDVLRPILGADDLGGRWSGDWVIDFGCDISELEAQAYAEPYKFLEKYVKPIRANNSRQARRVYWWRFGEPRRRLREMQSTSSRLIVTGESMIHRIFSHLDSWWLPDNKLVAIESQNGAQLAILSSKFHNLWTSKIAGRQGVVGNVVYPSASVLPTFPFPSQITEDLIELSNRLEATRSSYLNPEEWTQFETLVFPATVGGPWHSWIAGSDSMTNGTVAEARYRRRVAKAGMEKILAERTLTNLYNENPAWLRQLHKELDEAVAEAYGFPADLSDEEILARLLKLNLERAEAQSSKK